MSKIIATYSKISEKLVKQYEAVTTESVHTDWLHLLPRDGAVLDIGAGSGRDAVYFANQGFEVVAVEPAINLRTAAKVLHPHPNIHWLDDTLPTLVNTTKLQCQFDLILLSAVWMHIPATERYRSLRKISELLKPDGHIVITLRHGPSPDERTMYSVSKDEIAQFSTSLGLVFNDLTPKEKRNDVLGRDSVKWETVALTLPDDGTGSFSLLRNIVINDAKSSTYKLGLLRSLLRIAEAHPGAVLERNSRFVSIPLGLVAFYWLKLYKTPLDTFSLKQSPNSGLGFVKADGWEQLKPLATSDLQIGERFTEHIATALWKTLKDIAITIRDMPSKYITLPNSDQRVFEVDTPKRWPTDMSCLLSLDTFTKLGKFHVPIDIWTTLSRFSVWIEPTLINEWVLLMSSYKGNQHIKQAKLRHSLNLDEPIRSTQRVRKRIETILNEQNIHCVWSHSEINSLKYCAVDHAFPFVRWPNNDLWNLLPTSVKANSQKSDKLPSAKRLFESKDTILDWWTLAWGDNKEEFNLQAILSLPNLSGNPQILDVYEAMQLQRARIKELQQLPEW